MAGRPWEEIRGFGWARSVHPDDVELLRAAVERYEHERGFLELRYRTLHPDGTVRILHSRVRAVDDADGAHLGTVGFVQDVTAYQATADRAAEAQKLETIGRLASRIAHDFNNSLAAIQASASLMERRARDPKDDELISIIKRAVTDASVMTSQLLGLTRQQVGQDAVTRLDAELESFAPFLRQLLGEGVLLSVEIGATNKTVALASHQVGQIVVNLAVNARDAGAKRITLATSAEEGTIELRVSDDGQGVPEAIRDQVFEPYFTTKPVGQGTGLGLATVHDLAQRAGGAVSIESVPGEGSSFRVRILAPKFMGENWRPAEVKCHLLGGGASTPWKRLRHP